MANESAVRTDPPATDEEIRAAWQRLCDRIAQSAEPLERFNARKTALERLHDEYAGRAIAYREVWNGDAVRMAVVETADTLELLMDAVEQLPAEAGRLTVVSLPHMDEIEIGGVSFDS